MSSFIVSPDVPVIYQYPVLPTGCEATSLTYDSHGNGAMVLTWQLLLFLCLILSLDMCLSHTQKMSSFILSLLACSTILEECSCNGPVYKFQRNKLPMRWSRNRMHS